ncbi:tetratricopeptide repeat protein [Halonatronum saccharophilum]|uniref:tetratricopeptide repeat protein n=1 Tax=Halonatronum saccharophilum TaxID=150060 RepID=UPI0004BB8754|nr:tetratricopeptide repeat protein [Halonatronum saccharophilum]
MNDKIRVSLLAEIIWKEEKKGLGITRKLLKNKFGKQLHDEDYITISDEINEIPRNKKKSKEEVEKLIKNNNAIMKIIDNKNNSTNINVVGNNNRIAGRDYIESQMNIKSRMNIGTSIKRATVKIKNENDIKIREEKINKELTPLPNKNINFIGREKELKEIDEKISEKNRIISLTGTAGIGKTAVANEYFYQKFAEYSYIGWINCENNFKESIIRDINEDNLGVVFENDENLNLKFKKIINKLASLEQKTLLVLDEIDEVNEALRALMKLDIDLILISRSKLEEFMNITEINIGRLNKDESVELFCEYFGESCDNEYVMKLVELTEGYALMIKLLATNIKTSRNNLDDFYQSLLELGFNLEKDDYSKREIFEYLKRILYIFDLKDKEKDVLLNLSILPSKPIKIIDLKGWLGLETIDVINDLVEKGWLQEINNKESYVIIHNVIQEVIREEQELEFSKIEDLVDAITELLSLTAGENFLSKKEYLDLGVSILNHCQQKNIKLANLSNILGVIYRNLGEIGLALKYNEKAIEIAEEILDEKDPNLATCYSNISLIYQDLGELGFALEYAKQAKKIREEVLDDDHPDLATSYNNISMIYKDLGELKLALKYTKKAKEIRKEVLDDDHPDLATSYNNISVIYQDLGELKLALKYAKKAKEVKEEVLDDGHPDLATPYNNISMIYQDLGRLDLALEYSKEAMKILEGVLDKKHPNLAISYNNISTIYRDLGRLDLALEYVRKAIEIEEVLDDKLDDKHPNLADSYNNISTIYKDMWELEKALEYAKKSVKIREEILNKNHPKLVKSYNDLADSYNDLGNIYKDREELKLALEYTQKALKIKEEVLSENHPELAKSYSDVGKVYKDREKPELALEYMQKALTMRKEVLNKNHPDLLDSYMETGEIYYINANIKKAVNHLETGVLLILNSSNSNKQKVNSYLKKYIEILNEIKDKDKEEIDEFAEGNYINTVKIKDYLSIKDVELENLKDNKEIYFLGENGDGKTILLQAILLSFMCGEEKVGLINEYLKNNLEPFTLEGSDSNKFSYRYYYQEDHLKSRKENLLNKLFQVRTELFFNNIFSYGSNRSKKLKKSSKREIFESLFTDKYILNDPIDWLQEVDYHEQSNKDFPVSLDDVKKMVKEILNNNVEIIKVSPKDVVFKERGNEVKLHQLSSGYKNVIIWVLDLLSRILSNSKKVKSLKDLTGVVLIDEIEIHLHPKWEYKIVRNLREWFPNIQFIISTHSPVVIMGASEDAVIYRLFKEDGETKLSPKMNRMKNEMANTILTSPLFDLGTARAFGSKLEELNTADDYIYSKIYKRVKNSLNDERIFDEEELNAFIDEEIKKYEKRRGE